MKFAGILAAFVALALSIGNAMAVPPGKTLEFASPQGKVTFDGKAHADKGLQCANCHSNPKLFEMKKGGDKMSMAAMGEGKFCGTCHNGAKAFSVKAPADCVKCHKTGAAGAGADVAAPTPTASASQSANQKSTLLASKQETPGEYVDDTIITTKVKAAVFDEPSLKSAEINVETYKGIVQLTGFVSSRADISTAVEVAIGIKGVKSVKNDMILKGTQ